MSDLPPKNFYVYCISSKITDEHGLKKLGLTIHPVHRLRQYATGDAPGCGLDKKYDSLWKVNVSTDKELREMEKILHRNFIDKRLENTEWFRLSFEDVELFMKLPQKFEVKQLSFDEVKDINTKYKEPIADTEKGDYDEEVSLIKVQKLNNGIKGVKSMPKQQRYLIKGSNTNIPQFVSKPEQGQKTREVAKIIDEDFTQNSGILSFFISQSRINQSNNAANNFSEFIFDKYNVQGFPNLHGKGDKSIDPYSYLYRAEKEHQRFICALANKTRLKVCKDIISGWLKSNKRNAVRFYLDEAQKTISLVLNYVYKLLDNEEKSRFHLILIDAHLEGILENKDFKREFIMGVNKLPNAHDLSNYLFMSSFDLVDMNWKTTQDVLDSYTSGAFEINKGEYILWPLPYRKIDQYSDALAIVNAIKNSCLLLINGDAFHIFTDDPHIGYINLPRQNDCVEKDCKKATCGACYPNIKDNEFEVVKKLKGLFAKDKTFILAGNHCIDRAMTYHNATMSFSRLIVASDVITIKSFFDRPGMTWDKCSTIKQEDISQVLKRIAGSFKSQLVNNNIPLPIMMGPQNIFNGVIAREKISTAISGMSGIIDKPTYESITHSVLTGTEITVKPKTRADYVNPQEYYFKKFHCSNMPDEKIQELLQIFREKIGRDRVVITTIKSRLYPNEKHRDETGRYIEDVVGKKIHLTLNDFKNSGGDKILDTGLDKDTTSRIRICWDGDEVLFVIVWCELKDNFLFNKTKLKFVAIEGDGNCLFSCFIAAKIYGKSVGRLRGEVASFLEDNIEHYSKFMNNYTPELLTSLTDNIRRDGQWSSDIMDLLPHVISDLLKVNVFIYKFKTGFDSGGEEVLFDTPMVIPEDHRFEKDIHLKYSNGNHYDLFQPCV